MKALIYQCALILSVVLSAPVFAKQISGLYDAKALVADQQAQSRLAGAQQGLLEVLQKVSGSPVDSGLPAVASALKIADQYLYQFSYAKVEEAERLLQPEAETLAPGTNWLNMRFEGKAIQRIVKKASLPRWGTNRPTMLVWLAVDDGQRQIIADGLDHLAHAALLDGAKRRGVPIVLPIYDLEDSIRLPMEQLWGMFSEGVVSASDRYGAESVLMARVVKMEDGQWQGRWRFIFRDKEFDYEFQEETLDAQVLAGLSAGTQVLANAFALKSHGLTSNELRLDVLQVGNLKQYASLLKYLEKLAITKQVAVTGVKDKRISFDLSLNGSFAQLEQTLALDKKLVKKKVPEAAVESVVVEPDASKEAANDPLQVEPPELALNDNGAVEFIWRP